MKFLFDLGGVFFDWDPHYFYKDVFKDKEERDNFLNNICNDEWNIQQDAGRLIKNAETDLITALSMNASFQDKSIYLLLGKIYFLQQKYTESILMIDRELDLNPRNRIAILWQIRTLSKISDYEEAVIYANKLIKISPNEAEGYAILGDIKLYMGNLEESNQYHEKALKIDPNYNIASKKKIL